MLIFRIEPANWVEKTFWTICLRTKDFRLMNDYYKWLGPNFFLLSICYSLRKAFLWVGKPQWLYFNLIDCLVDWLIDWLIGWLIVWLVDCLVGWLIVWLLGWLFVWLIGWWTDWLMNSCYYLQPWTSFGSLASWLLQQRISRNPYSQVGNSPPPNRRFSLTPPK